MSTDSNLVTTGAELQIKPQTLATARDVASVNEIARSFSNALLTFVSLAVYIGIIVASTTDEMLVRDQSVTLPVFNVPISIVGFFTLAPIIFVLHHLYLVIYFNSLAETIQKLHSTNAVASGFEETNSLERLVSMPYIRLLAYPEHISRLERMSAYIPLGIVPMLIVLWLQYRFIPYRDAPLTSGVLTGASLAEVFLLVYWIPIEILKRHFLYFKSFQKAAWLSIYRFQILGFVCLLFVGASIIFRLHPVEANDLTNSGPFDSATRRFGAMNLSRTVLAHSDVSTSTINQIKKLGIVQGTAKSIDEVLESVAGFYLQGKDLRGADLHEAVLPKADFRARPRGWTDLSVWCKHIGKAESNSNYCSSRLDGANVEWAVLDEARFDGASLGGIHFAHSWLRNSTFVETYLDYADLTDAKLQETRLNRAELNHANLSYANLCGAIMTGAHVDAADLSHTDLRHANLIGVAFEGTTGTPDRLKCVKLEASAMESLRARLKREIRDSALQNALLDELKENNCSDEIKARDCLLMQ